MQKIDTTILVNQKKKSTDEKIRKSQHVCQSCGGIRFRTISKKDKIVVCKVCGATKNL